MGYFDQLPSTQTQLQQMVSSQLGAYRQIRMLLTQQCHRLYADPEQAQAYVQAMGTGAASQFQVSAKTLQFINDVAPIVGMDPMPNPMPSGYSIQFAEDGSGTLTFTAPTPTASAGNKAEATRTTK